MKHRPSPILIAATAAAFIAAPALATGSETISVKVGIADLDLRSDGDVARLHRRIGYAATTVCGRADPRNLALMPKIRRCRQDALNDASRHADIIVAAVRAGKEQRVAVRETLRVMAR